MPPILCFSLHQLDCVCQLFSIHINLSLCCGYAAVSSKFSKHTHTNAFACQACDKRASATVRTCISQTARFVDVEQQLARSVGVEEVAFLAVEQCCCGRCVAYSSAILCKLALQHSAAAPKAKCASRSLTNLEQTTTTQWSGSTMIVTLASKWRSV